MTRNLNPTLDTNFLIEWGVSHWSTLDFIARFNSYINAGMDLREAVVMDMLKCNVLPSTKAGKDPEGFMIAVRDRISPHLSNEDQLADDVDQERVGPY